MQNLKSFKILNKDLKAIQFGFSTSYRSRLKALIRMYD